MPTQIDLLSAGDCPICSSSGMLALLVSQANGSALFVCPMCGVAWASPPAPHTVDAIVAIEDAAPEGLRFPSAEEVQGVTDAGVPLRREELADWRGLLAKFVPGL